MARCHSCSAENPDQNGFCGICGAALASASQAPTVAMPKATTPTPSGSFDEGRFPPGMVLAERYRIIGLLGRGGMGEVYRANDLKLGQPVALKFLPPATAKNPQLLARFHSEVSIARQVSHPNVCRVYDIGEVDGSTFLSMEYVDGEDLRSLLRRIGRLPGDKAIEIARKLCAGLAAAHDKGVLHRDLKPANIMIDGRGQVLITDFGLAALAGQLEGAHLRDGTPAYMAPEQLAGKEVSVRSDIYALGLVLHEMFTGKRAFEDGSARTTPTNVTSLAKDIDPLVERVILRCLDVEPRNRPASALAVAAALPGGDPLAAALAAGDTPTPAMVAASEDTEGVSVRTASICLAWILVGLVVLVILGGKTNVLQRTPFPSSPEILAQKARETIQSLGYADAPRDRAYGFRYDAAYQTYEAEQGNPAASRDRLAKGQPPLIYFWYRQSPRPLVASDSTGAVSPSDPPPIISEMIGTRLDTQGRLLQLDVLPPQVEENLSPPSPAFAGADWKGSLHGRRLGHKPLHLSGTAVDFARTIRCAGGMDGVLRHCSRDSHTHRSCVLAWEACVLPDHRAVVQTRTHAAGSAGIPPGVLILSLIVLALSAFLAWRNFRAKRGDIRGANRAAAFVFTLDWLGLLLNAHHVPTADEMGVLFSVTVDAVVLTAITWALYLALEPYVRRRWPQSMISWSRVLGGGFRDPIVGAHLLFGVASGIGLGFIHAGARLVMEHYGLSSFQLFGGAYSLDANLFFLDTRGLAGGLLLGLVARFLAGLALTFILMLLRVLLRQQGLAAIALMLLWASVGMGAAHTWMGAVPSILFAALFAATLLRFGGLLPTIVMLFRWQRAD